MKVTQNVGGLDRYARISVGIALVILVSFLTYYGALPVGLIVIGYVVGGIALITGLASYCPINTVLGINTCGNACKAEQSPVPVGSEPEGAGEKPQG